MEENPGFAFCCIERLASDTSTITYGGDGGDANNAVRKLFATQEDMMNKQITSELTIIFSLPWFRRGWVFQEVALSASKPSEFWMGFKHISLSRLLVSGTAVLNVSAELEAKYSFMGRASRVKPDKALQALWMDKCLVNFGQDSLHSAPPASDLSICRRLIYILSAGHMDSKVTDPRDAIYSLYGLLSTSRLPAMIQPNYTKSVSAVFHAVASFLLSHMGIDILGFLLSSLDGMDDCPSWVPDFSCLRRYCTLRQQYPASSVTYDNRAMGELLSIEEGHSHDSAAPYNLELSSAFLRISCPIFWLETIESVVHVNGDWEYPKITLEQSLDDFLLDRSALMQAVLLGVIDSLCHATQTDQESYIFIWHQFLERVAGLDFFPYWAQLIGIEGRGDGCKDLFDAFAVDQMFKPVVERILHGCLGITRDGHLIMGRRLKQLQRHDRIGFIPNSLTTFIFRPCGSGYQLITSSWQSDAPELVCMGSLRLGNKERITIV
ncbi:hypothetical protein LB507_010917, partial [Fusarium sp. FIESC RH6]